jgi:hypothetical protein
MPVTIGRLPVSTNGSSGSAALRAFRVEFSDDALHELRRRVDVCDWSDDVRDV